MKVFDISEFQDIDIWDTLIDEDVEGVIINMGETISGDQELDNSFCDHANAAVSNNIPYGIYFVTHAHSIEEAEQEAQWINDMVYQYLNGQEPELGVWIDCEVSTIKMMATHTYIMKMIEKLKSFGFSQVGIYASYSFFTDYFDLQELEELQIPIWVANYGRVNYLKEEYPNLNHVGWQYTETYNGMNLDADEWYDE